MNYQEKTLALVEKVLSDVGTREGKKIAFVEHHDPGRPEPNSLYLIFKFENGEGKILYLRIHTAYPNELVSKLEASLSSCLAHFRDNGFEDAKVKFDWDIAAQTWVLSAY